MFFLFVVFDFVRCWVVFGLVGLGIVSVSVSVSVNVSVSGLVGGMLCIICVLVESWLFYLFFWLDGMVCGFDVEFLEVICVWVGYCVFWVCVFFEWCKRCYYELLSD